MSTVTHPRMTAGPRLSTRLHEIVTAVSMTLGRGPAARMIADLAELTPDDRLADIGCGPGTAARQAARRGATVTGVDPSPDMLRLARWAGAAPRTPDITYLTGSAESLPLPDDAATIAWAISSVHHWNDRAAGLAEITRVLAPGGRVLLAERLVTPGARGHAVHGLTHDQAAALARKLRAAGFEDVHQDSIRIPRRTLVVIRGRR
jgi:ubiquinone/menaquinone biosynthesis C-methylase UbiE